ncbi:MAG: ABC-F family ATP-binding cassette domain-containing protein [Christensenellales bacterium]|jgi:ATP-binding cassette subfamily F protein 3
MIVLSAQNLEKHYGERSLLCDVSFELKAGEKAALVGVNGCGKTTLFRLITQEQKHDAGAVHIQKGIKLGYMEQHAVKDTERSLYEEVLSVFKPLQDIEKELEAIHAGIQKGERVDALVKRQHFLNEAYEHGGGYTYKNRTRTSLLGLGFDEEQLALPTGVLSGGQRSKAALCKMLLSKADVLLLDEPTNHLDLEAVQWLEEFLLGYRGAYIVISHDRYFLDKVTQKTFELQNGRLTSFSGNYSTYAQKKETAQDIEWRHYRNREKEIRRLKGIIAQQKRWNRERNIKAAESKQKVLDKLNQAHIKPEKDPAAIRFHFQAPPQSGNDVLFAKGLCKAFEGKPLFRDISFEIKRQERVFLLGANGCGKTTLLRMLMGELPAAAGEHTLGAGVKTAYYEQSQRNLNGHNTVLDEAWNARPAADQTEIRNALAAFLFRGDDVFKRISTLSGGERARLSLLKLMMNPVNFLLLDEPTNHLDIHSLEVLERALEEYEGTMLIVSHDRYLINRLADRVLHMSEGGIREYIGGYDDYLAAMQEDAARRVLLPKEKNVRQNEYFLKKERQQRENSIKKLEREIALLEQECTNLQQKINDAQSEYEQLMELTAHMERTQQQLKQLYTRWESAQLELEDFCEAHQADR